LEETLNGDDLELAGDLMRFLQPEEALDFTKSIESRNLEGAEIHNIEIDLDDQEFYTQELLLARYARKLLAQQQLRKLLRFSRGVNHELRPWLIRERHRAAMIDDFDTALAMLHLQFNLPYPELMQQSNHVILHSPTSINTKISPRYSPKKKYSLEIEDSILTAKFEISQLLDDMIAADCAEWSLLLATVLMDAHTIVNILKDHFTMWKPYQKVLSAQESVGYKELLQALEKEVSEPQTREYYEDEHQMTNIFAFT